MMESPAVTQARELLHTLITRFGRDLVGILQDLSEEIDKKIVVTIAALPDEDEANIQMTISKVEEPE